MTVRYEVGSVGPVETVTWTSLAVLAGFASVSTTSPSRIRPSKRHALSTRIASPGRTWIYDKFKPYAAERGIAWDYQQGQGVAIEGGKPFPGFAWRNTPELNINAIWLYRYMSRPEQGASKVWWDHLVVAKKYIGPLTSVSR